MWAIKDDAIRSLAGHPALQALFELLETVFGKGGHKAGRALPPARPFLLGRDFGKFSWLHPNSAPGEMYRFQLGPRAWSKEIYTYAGHRIDPELPLYEREAEAFAKQLKLAGWEKLAEPLVDLILERDGAEDEQCTAQVTLCWQEDGRFVVLQDRQARKAIAFQWTDDGLTLLGEAHPHPLCQHNSSPAFVAHRRPVVSVDEGTYPPKRSERAGRMDEFMAAVEWRYATRLDRRLDGLLLEACDRLGEVEGDLAMAFAGHRFNDASGDPAWLAVRLDNFAWENGAYFRSNAVSLRSAPSQVHQLLGMLVHLQSSGIGSAFGRGYGYPVEPLDVIGLFRQAGAHYFACVNSQGSCGPVYAIEPALGETRLCGFSDRFDWNFHSSSRAGGIVPKRDVLEIVSLDELVRRVETGDTPFDAGPPHDLEVAWEAYLPSEPGR